MKKKFDLRSDERHYGVRFERDDETIDVVIASGDVDDASTERRASFRVVHEGEAELVLETPDGERRRLFVVRDGQEVFVAEGGRDYRFRRHLGEREGGDDAGVDSGDLTAPMTGRVVKVQAAVGDEVDANRTVVVVEAMKMEHRLKAPFAARVVEVNCVEGDQVDAGAVLVRLESTEEPS